VPIILVGTKSDVRDDAAMAAQLARKGLHVLSAEKAQLLAREIGAVDYLECSALTQRGVHSVFDEAIRASMNTKKSVDQRSADMATEINS
jgi:GTPase SAR1 family protein